MLCGKVSFCVDILWVANFGCFSLLNLSSSIQAVVRCLLELMQTYLWMLISGIHRLHFYKMHLWDNVLKWLSSVIICFPPDISSFGSVLERLS